MQSYQELLDRSERSGLPLDRLVREELQKLILRFLGERRFFESGVFQGGTAIRLLYGGARFSEGLDFVFRKKNSEVFLDLAGLLAGLEGFMGRQAPFLEYIGLSEQKSSGTLSRFRARAGWAKREGRVIVNLEFANVRSFMSDVRLLRVDPVDVPVRVEEESEILADKLVALGLREYIKGRDLWDMAFLTRERGVRLPDHKMVLEKAGDYGRGPSEFVADLRARLPLLEKEGGKALDAEMRRFLPPGLYRDLAGTFADTIVRVCGFVAAAVGRLERLS